MATLSSYEKLLEKHFHAQLIIPQLAHKIGLEEAIIIQQLHYWLQKCGKLIESNIWVYNTFEEWHKQFRYWSIAKIKRYFYSLEEQGFIISKKLNACKSNHTKWYSINYHKLIKILKECLPEKNLGSDQYELSLYQSDTIINNKPDNNYQDNNFLYDIEKEGDKRKSDRQKFYFFQKKEAKKSFTEKCSNETKHKIRALDKKTIQAVQALSEEETEICKQMIDIWNKVFLNTKDKATLSNTRAQKLLTLWEKVVGKSIEKWEELCMKVNSSRFLMGEKKEGFKAYFDWIIEELTATRILAGEYGVGDRVPDIEKERQREKLAETLKQKEENMRLQEEKRKKDRFEIEVQNLANELRAEILNKLEMEWGRAGEEKAKEEFEKYMLSNKQDYSSIDQFKTQFRNEKWGMIFAEYIFTQFKLHHYIQKNEEDFILEAKNKLSNHLYYIKSNSIEYQKQNFI